MKKLFLSILACMLVIAPGCSKRTRKLTYEEMTTEQIEHERQKHKTRAIALLTAGSISWLGGAVCLNASTFVHTWTGAIALLTVGVITGYAGIYMVFQGVHDLACAKQIRRMQMREAAQQRKLERALAAQTPA